MVCSAKMNHTRKREASEPEKWQKRDLSVLKTAGRLLLASSFRAASLVTGWLAVSEEYRRKKMSSIGIAKCVVIGGERKKLLLVANQ